MRRRGVWLKLLLLLVAATLGAGPALAYCSTIGLPAGRQVAELQTPLGQLCIELMDDPEEAPGHVENFLWYLDNGDVAGTFFHRTVDDFIIQGSSFHITDGDITQVDPRPDVEVTNEPCELDAKDENNRDICSVRGNEAYTVALAKRSGEPNSGTTSWFINLVDNRGSGANLDTSNGGFTVFGRVLYEEGKRVVDEIGTLPRISYDEYDLFWTTQDMIGFLQQPAPFIGEQPPLVEDPVACHDHSELATVFVEDFETYLFERHDPPDIPPFYETVSAGCGTPLEIPFEEWRPAPGPPTCPDLDRIGLRVLQPTVETGLSPLVLEPWQGVSYTCEQLAEARTQRTAWIDARKATWIDGWEDAGVYIDTAVVRVAVPEPSAPAAAVGALGTLAWLRRRARRSER